MKLILLLAACGLLHLGVQAQDAPVNNLPAGKYETLLKQGTGKWAKGDILLSGNSQYRLSAGGETGDFRFSAAAQKVFFTSGPLKGAIAKTSMQANAPAIILPAGENQNIGLSLASTDIIAVLRD